MNTISNKMNVNKQLEKDITKILQKTEFTNEDINILCSITPELKKTKLYTIIQHEYLNSFITILEKVLPRETYRKLYFAYPFIFFYIPIKYLTCEICVKEFTTFPLVIRHIPEKFIIKEMFNKIVIKKLLGYLCTCFDLYDRLIEAFLEEYKKDESKYNIHNFCDYTFTGNQFNKLVIGLNLKLVKIINKKEEGFTFTSDTKQDTVQQITIPHNSRVFVELTTFKTDKYILNE